MLTAGEVKAMLANVPDSAQLHVAQDELAQWFKPVKLILTGLVDAEGFEMNSGDMPDKEVNAIMLFLR